MKKHTAVEWLEQLYDSRPNYEQFILSEEFVKAKQRDTHGTKTNNQCLR
jgi:hypothetical protein